MNQQKAAIQASVKSDVRTSVTAVATQLVKTPTATNAQLIAAVLAAPKTDGNTVNVTGKWDDYTVVGYNGTAGASGSFTYTFDSKTGKYTPTGN